MKKGSLTQDLEESVITIAYQNQGSVDVLIGGFGVKKMWSGAGKCFIITALHYIIAAF